MTDTFSLDKYTEDANKCITKYNQLLLDISRIYGLKYKLSLNKDTLFLLLASTPGKK